MPLMALASVNHVSTCRIQKCDSVKEWEVYQRPNGAVKGRSELNVEYDYVSLLR